MIYFAQAEIGGPIKIGYSSRPTVRVRDLSKALRVLKVRNGGKDVESAIHIRLQEYRIDGEWFLPDDAVFRVMNEPERETVPSAEEFERAVRECIPVLLRAAFSGPAEMAAVTGVTRRAAENWWTGRNMPGLPEMLALGKVNDLVRRWWRVMMTCDDAAKFAAGIAGLKKFAAPMSKSGPSATLTHASDTDSDASIIGQIPGTSTAQTDSVRDLTRGRG